MKKLFFEKIQAKSIFFKSKVKFLIFSKNQLKNMILFCLKNASKKESRESFTLKLSVARWKFHETFGGQMKVSWNFRMESESFMKLSYGQRKFHRKFRWNFRMATESFSETFAKLSFAWLFFRCIC